jgi:hypothetical protein
MMGTRFGVFRKVEGSMDRDRFEKMVSRLVREAGAPGAEHERLLAELAVWAASMNYKVENAQFTSGARPDVLRRTSDNEFLFVGDAKDAENEDATNGDTLKRIQGYFREFAARLGETAHKGGILAIATNSAEAAADWVPALNTLACTAGITGKGGVQPNFKVTETRQGKTWIIWW